MTTTKENTKTQKSMNLPSAEWDACFVGVLVGRRGGKVVGGNGGSSMVPDGGGVDDGLPGNGNPC